MSKKSSKKRKRERRRLQQRQRQQQQQREEESKQQHLPNSQSSSRSTPATSSSSSLLSSSPQQQPLQQSQNQTTYNLQETNLSFGSRKRSLPTVTFVYPSSQHGTTVSYHFGKRQKDQQQKQQQQQQQSIQHSDETLDDILFPSRKRHNDATENQDTPSVVATKRSRKESFEETKGQRKDIKQAQMIPPTKTQEPVVTDEKLAATNRDAATDLTNDTTKQQLSETKEEIISKKNKTVATSESTRTDKRPRRESIDDGGEAMGILSGLSVEQAIRDKKGCRPRSNSTDGELNLPRRGLCDEREVLLSYKWNLAKFHDLHATPLGFINLGNTCYLNSTLQCLAHLPPFCQSLMSMPAIEQNGVKRKITQGKKITMMLRNLFNKVHGPHGTANRIVPQAIVKAVPTLGSCGSRNGYTFRPGRQEDAHEFLLHLLDAMNDGELREAGINPQASGWRDRLPVPRLDETTFVHRIFGGYLRSQIRCTSCGYRSNTYDPFLDLSLEVSQKSCHSVYNALHEFTRKETLDSMNRWKCSGCKKRVCATKQLTVFRPPLSVCIQLKRFTYSGSMGFGGFGGYTFGNYNGFGMSRGGKKISKPIDFPSHFKLALSDGRSCGYALTGVVIHVGGSASSGHYTAYVKKPGSQGNDRWFHMDDSFVEAVSERTVLRQKDAYLLFYSREEVKLEFPTPPLRASMTAEEAKEFGRARARARADSLTESQAAMRSKIADQSPASTTSNQSDSKVPYKTPPRENFIGPWPREAASEQSSGDSSSEWARAFEKGSEDSLCYSGTESASTTSGKTGDGIETPTKAQASNTVESPSTASEYSSKACEIDSSPSMSHSARNEASDSQSDSESSGASEKSVSESPDPAERKTGPAYEDESSGSEGSPLPKINTSSPTSSEGESSDDQGGDKESPRRLAGQEKITLSREDSSLSSTSSDSSTSDASSSSSRSGKNESSTPGSTSLTRPAKSTPFETGDPKNSRTRIVLDRGEGRGKVEVMMGPRFKSKAWTPKTAAGKKGQGYELLGNLPVDKWDEDDRDDALQTPTKHERSELVKVLERKEKSRKNMMYVDRWDAMLDQGKKKKVKSMTADKTPGSAEPKSNAFQRIQTGLQRMNRGRAKGAFRQEKHRKKNGKSRK